MQQYRQKVRGQPYRMGSLFFPSLCGSPGLNPGLWVCVASAYLISHLTGPLLFRLPVPESVECTAIDSVRVLLLLYSALPGLAESKYISKQASN